MILLDSILVLGLVWALQAVIVAVVWRLIQPPKEGDKQP